MLILLQSETFLIWVTALFLALVMVWDWRWRRIPNIVTYPTLAAAVLYRTIAAGVDGLFLSLGGIIVGGGLLFIGYLFRLMGAGDVKAMAVLGGIWGGQEVLNIMLYTFVAGGVVAIGILLLHGLLAETVKRYGSMAKVFLLSGAISYLPPSLDEGKQKLPYGVVIAIGALLWLTLGDIL